MRYVCYHYVMLLASYAVTVWCNWHREYIQTYVSLAGWLAGWLHCTITGWFFGPLCRGSFKANYDQC